jgi:hypothetical protein
VGRLVRGRVRRLERRGRRYYFALVVCVHLSLGKVQVLATGIFGSGVDGIGI